VSGQGRASVFVVGRNPQEDSKLPYLLRLPLEGGLVLKARELWPATARVYCHRFEEAWPEEAEIVEQTPVLLCRRRGAAIDLVLDRARLARSQFVFTEDKGREAVFWQTQRRCRGQILGPLQAGAGQRQLARRPTGPARGALPGGPPRLRRLPPIRRRLDLPLPHHSTCRHVRPARTAEKRPTLAASAIHPSQAATQQSFRPYTR
jgi:hypothetical protein